MQRNAHFNFNFNPHPHIGGDEAADILGGIISYFNPHPHIGGDPFEISDGVKTWISIHTPT